MRVTERGRAHRGGRRRALTALALAACVGAVGSARPVSAAADDAAAARKEGASRFQAGEKAMRGQEWDKAETELKAAIEADPLHTPALVALGQTYMATKRYAEALSTFERARRTLEDQAASRAREEAHGELRRDEQIRALRDQLRDLQAGQVRSTSNDRLIQQTEDQLRALEGQRERGTGEADAVPGALWLSIGSANFRLGRASEAEEAFRKAVLAEPKLGEAHNNLGVLYMLSGRLDQAQAEIELAEKAKFPVSPGLKKDLAARKEAAKEKQ